MGKQKRFRKERAEKATDALLAEGTPSRPKWYYLVLRLVNVFFGCVAISVIAGFLFQKYIPDNTSVGPALITMGLWAVWIVYVFKIMRFKGEKIPES